MHHDVRVTHNVDAGSVRAPRILILNQNSANFGDDIAGFAAIEQLRQRFPGCQIGLLYNEQDKMDSEHLPVEGDDIIHFTGNRLRKLDLICMLFAVLGWRWPIRLAESVDLKRLLAIISSMDIVVVSPCGANIGKYRDWWFLTRTLTAVTCGKRPIFHLNTISSSGSRIFDAIACYVLRRSYVFVRQWDNFEYLIGRGIAASVGVDSAFSLPVLMEGEHTSLKHTEAGRELVLIVTDIRKWFQPFSNFNMRSFIEELCRELASFAVTHGLRIRLVPHLHGRFSEIDLLNQTAECLRGFQSDVAVNVDNSVTTFHEYDRRIARAMLVVTMRYHGVVVAARHAVPFVALAYEEKMLAVSRYVGATDAVIDLKSWDAKLLAPKLQTILSNRVEISTCIKQRLPILRRLAQLPDDFIWLSSFQDESMPARRRGEMAKCVPVPAMRQPRFNSQVGRAG